MFLHTNQAYNSFNKGLFAIIYYIIFTNDFSCVKNKFNIFWYDKTNQIQGHVTQAK